MSDAANTEKTPPIAGGLHADLVAGAVIALASLITYFWLIPGYVTDTMDDYGVGPRFMPQLATIVLFLMALVHMLVTWRKLQANGASVGESGSRLGVELVVITLIAGLTFLLVAKIGFIVASLFLVSLGSLAAGERTWWKILILAAGVTVVIDFGAWWGFSVDLP